ncbi:hypothetical protein MYAM1_001693 [Malassezia yamatoensis]|uniref:HIT domain-containing protein n=1 Tax=Malassezia yamatoensis TaxID=253288 RepID=A0AAJ5YR81_9BASI|nr:hypothetical protein MYAM1_001693 [Malassezia yamatoensis]
MSSTAKLKADEIQFGFFTVSDQVFYENSSAAAIVNLQPIVPGHVLVIPKKHYARLADVPQNDLALLFEAVQFVGKMVERAYTGDSLSITIQDGPNAGQSVDHLHVHVLPRRAGDITPNDKIYEHLEQFGLELRSMHEKQLDSDRQARTQEQMNAEAAWLRVQCQSFS